MAKVRKNYRKLALIFGRFFLSHIFSIYARYRLGYRITQYLVKTQFFFSCFLYFFTFLQKNFWYRLGYRITQYLVPPHAFLAKNAKNGKNRELEFWGSDLEFWGLSLVSYNFLLIILTSLTRCRSLIYKYNFIVRCTYFFVILYI